jgi:hypothetical protein
MAVSTRTFFARVEGISVVDGVSYILIRARYETFWPQVARRDEFYHDRYFSLMKKPLSIRQQPPNVIYNRRSPISDECFSSLIYFF